MRRLCPPAVLCALIMLTGNARRDSLFTKYPSIQSVNCKLHGRILDFTHNHGSDRRIWSAALCQKRDLYVYLPPGFNPGKKYPLGIFLHGATQDEQFFMHGLVERFDQAIVRGKLPPFIVAVPDGSLLG